MVRLIWSLDTYADGYIPCLSSGEGDVMDDELWWEVVQATKIATKKPVYAGIKRGTIDRVNALIQKGENIGITGFTIPLKWSTEEDIIAYAEDIARRTALPIIWYNTEKEHLSTREGLQRLANIANTVGLKDSSMNEGFFKIALQMRKNGEISMGIFQGMEHQMTDVVWADGYIVSLANVEPELCRDCLNNPPTYKERIRELFWQYNLGKDWFVTLKALLFARWIFASAEQITPDIIP